MIGWLKEYWFLLGLLVVVSVGLGCSQHLALLTEQTWLQTSLVFAVMCMMAAPIPLELVSRTLAKPWPGFLATAFNMGILPLIAVGVAPLLAKDLSGGLIVAAAVPSTLASAAVWTRRAGGDDTVSILVTLLTNLSCVVLTPLWLVGVLGVQVELDLSELMFDLLLVVVVPIGLMQLCRWWSSAFARRAEQAKKQLSILCQFGILLMVLLGAVRMGQRLAADADPNTLLSIGQLLLVLMLVLGVHLVTLVLSWFAAKWTGVARPQRIAVSFSGSQKTLMIGLKLAIDCGVSILPMIAFHVCQLIVDAFIAQYWSRSTTEAGTLQSSAGD